MPRTSERFGALPRYPLAGMQEIRRRVEASGVDVIDLGSGDPEIPPPPAVVETLRRVAGDLAHSRYAYQAGLSAFREAVAAWMKRRFGVSVDPVTEVLPLIGSKEGIAHLPLAYVGPGDSAIIPDPGYRAYLGGVTLAGGDAYLAKLRPENDFLIPLDEVPEDVASRTRILYLNYPNNPTTAVAPDGYYEDAIRFCAERGAVLAHDHAYSEIAFEGYRPRSILEFDGAGDVAIEFHSMSKTYNMEGWRLGWAVGSQRSPRTADDREDVHGHRAVPRNPGCGRGRARVVGRLGSRQRRDVPEAQGRGGRCAPAGRLQRLGPQGDDLSLGTGPRGRGIGELRAARAGIGGRHRSPGRRARGGGGGFLPGRINRGGGSARRGRLAAGAPHLRNSPPMPV